MGSEYPLSTQLDLQYRQLAGSVATQFPHPLSTILLAKESTLLQFKTWSSLLGFRQELPSQWLEAVEDVPLKASMPCVISVSILLS